LRRLAFALSAAALLALLVGVAPARADSSKSAAVLKQAREHYDRGMAKYQLGEFDAAIEEFKVAFDASQAPGLLFNLAQASRLGKHPEQALHFYRSYLRMLPNAANRGDVEARIAELEPVVRAMERDAVPPPATDKLPQENAPLPPVVVAPPPSDPGVPSAPPPTVIERPASDRRALRRSLQIAGVSAAGVGLVSIGLGVYFGVSANNAQNQLSSQTSGWTQTSQTLYDNGQRDANVATALYTIGGVALAGGAALCLFGWHKKLLR
jgi:tetratricopeptide (TPR) repeat protein